MARATQATGFGGEDLVKQLTGLFLGAGASYEAGLPLVWELTKELKEWLTPDKLRDFARGWPRSWYVDVDESKFTEEIAFLKTEIYLRDVEPRSQILTAFDRFSVRA